MLLLMCCSMFGFVRSLPSMIVFEYMPQGNLRDYLREAPSVTHASVH